jgi:hypothetical protein
MAGVRHGDVLVRHFVGSSLELVDANTHRPIAIVPTLHHAVTIAAGRGGRVWSENVDNRGRALGEPILLASPEMTTH